MARDDGEHPDDWYRSDAWDSETQRAFEAKLARARVHRAQYLRIKGFTLTHTDDPSRTRAGRELLTRVIDEHPDQRVQATLAQFDLGDAYARSGCRAQAIVHLRAALAAEAEVTVSSETEIRLAEVLIDGGSLEELHEALGLLDRADELSHVAVFPASRWRWHVAQARAHAARHDPQLARKHALAALALLDANVSPFPRHPDAGLIKPDRRTVKELKALAKAPRSRRASRSRSSPR